MKPISPEQLLASQEHIAVSVTLRRAPSAEITKAIAAFLAGCQERSDKHLKVQCPNTYEMQRAFYVLSELPVRYARVYTRTASGNHVSAYCFVDLETGDIYKPATWKGPTKNFPRGNVLKPAGDPQGPFSWFGQYGIRTA